MDTDSTIEEVEVIQLPMFPDEEVECSCDLENPEYCEACQ